MEALYDTSYTFKGIFLPIFIVWGSSSSEIKAVYLQYCERAAAELLSKACKTVQHCVKLDDRKKQKATYTCIIIKKNSMNM